MKKNNIDIFVFAHRDFGICPENQAYKLVTLDKFETNKPNKMIVCDRSKDDILKMEHSYSEMARMHYLWKNVPMKDYVGTAHYRRFFEFLDDIPDMDEIFNEHDAILPNFNLGWPNIYNNYRYCHREEDIKEIIRIIFDKYPEYSEDTIKAMANDKFYPCNIFVLRKEMFYEYCNFVFGVLEEFDKRRGFTNDNQIYNYVLSHQNEYMKLGLNGRGNYQSRIQAFLSERLATIFFIHNIKNPLMMDMLLTEVHEEFEKTYFKQYEDKDISSNN